MELTYKDVVVTCLSTRLLRISPFRVLVIVWPRMCWESVTVTMTTLWYVKLGTCFISTLPRFLAILKCLEQSDGNTLDSLVYSKSWSACLLCRDRVPFVLTPDMAYVINGGERPSRKFHEFVDVCCHAFNLLRQHSGLFVNLFGLVSMQAVAIQSVSFAWCTIMVYIAVCFCLFGLR